MKPDTVHADLLVGAAEWRLLALALRRPTTALAREVASLAAEVADAELRAAAMAAVGGDAAAYLLVLGPGSAISPRLVAYRGTEDPGWILADVMRYYDAFAFHPSVEDPPDHVAVAADFVAYLYLKEAFARAASSDEAAELTRAARERFVHEHLAPVAERLSARLDDAGFHALAGAARMLARRVGPAPSGPHAEEMGAQPAPDACGACAATFGPSSGPRPRTAS